ncbi:hypothetical protein FOZ63_021760, partial [Perkinsus olseni]
QTALLRSLAVIASIAPSSYQAAIGRASVSPDVSSRLQMIFYDHETKSETIVEYLEQPGSEQLTITDVAHGRPLVGVPYVKFTVVADEDVLREYNLLLKDGVSEKKIKAKTPHSLKVQAMRRLGAKILKEYGKNFRPDGSPLYTWTRSYLETAEWVADYKVFLRRPEVNQPLRLTALRGLPGTGYMLYNIPPARAYSLYPSTWISVDHDEHKWDLSRRQLGAYSDYISPPGSNISADTWPKTLREVQRRYSEPKAVYIPNVVHWLTMGTFKASP